jgi:F-type H+-transporting ATPase subunit gamma
MIKAEATAPYTQAIESLKMRLCQSDISHPLLDPRSATKIGLIVISADHGLCGGLHTNLFSASDKFLEHKSSCSLELVLVGHKAVNYYAHKSWKVRSRIPQWTSKNTGELALPLSNQITKAFLNQEWDEAWVVYTHYINILHREVRIEKFLNLEKTAPDNTLKVDYIFEPSASHVVDAFLPRYCRHRIQWYLDQSYQSELSSRVVCMKAATKNADDVIEKLTHLRDKIRQEIITKEMLEITAGAQSLI